MGCGGPVEIKGIFGSLWPVVPPPSVLYDGGQLKVGKKSVWKFGYGIL
jgi:hypothetical protein